MEKFSRSWSVSVSLKKATGEDNEMSLSFLSSSICIFVIRLYLRLATSRAEAMWECLKWSAHSALEAPPVGYLGLKQKNFSWNRNETEVSLCLRVFLFSLSLSVSLSIFRSLFLLFKIGHCHELNSRDVVGEICRHSNVLRHGVYILRYIPEKAWRENRQVRMLLARDDQIDLFCEPRVSFSHTTPLVMFA